MPYTCKAKTTMNHWELPTQVCLAAAISRRGEVVEQLSSEHCIAVRPLNCFLANLLTAFLRQLNALKLHTLVFAWRSIRANLYSLTNQLWIWYFAHVSLSYRPCWHIASSWEGQTTMDRDGSPPNCQNREASLTIRPLNITICYSV